jgi:hypothetical protein
MTKENSIQIFENNRILSLWDDYSEEWYFSIFDVIAVLTDSPNPRKYRSL